MSRARRRHVPAVGAMASILSLLLHPAPAAAAGPWSPPVRLAASTGAANDGLGVSIALSADGSTLVAGARLAAPGGHAAQGAVYVFVRGPAGWTSGVEAALLAASDGASGDGLGTSVAVSADGSVVAAGAPNRSSRGAIYLFPRPAGGWASGSENALLTARGAATGDQLGRSVAVSADGSIVVAGAPGRAVGGNAAQGAAFLYSRPPAGWTTATEDAELTATQGLANAFLGISVAISRDNGTVVAGAHGTLPAGSAHVFVAPPTGWASATDTARLIAVDDSAGALLGWSVGISGDGTTVVAGSPSNEIGANAGQGSAYVFVKPPSGWISDVPAGKLTASDGAASDALGSSVTISGDGSVVAAGANGKLVGSNYRQGAAYVFTRPSRGWAATTESAELTAPDGSAGDQAGTSVAIDEAGSAVAAGAPGSRVGANTAQGAALLFQGSVRPTALLLPSSAHAPGAGGALYTTELSILNAGYAAAPLTIRFLGHDVDGTTGPEASALLQPGSSVTYADVLASTFGLAEGWGGLLVTSPSPSLVLEGQTSTPGFGGTFGQSVPGARAEDLVTAGVARSIVAIREDAAFRTNLVLANASAAAADADVTLVDASGAVLSSKRYPLLPSGMVQVTRVVRDLGVSRDVTGARLVVSTATPGGAVAAYASVIDNVTNDPRTLLPKGPEALAPETTWILPSSAHSHGANGAFYTTDLTVANPGPTSATYSLAFLGHDRDGRSAPSRTFALGPGQSSTFPDVLGSVFGETEAWGAIRITSASPSLVVLGETSTPGFGGTFGQSVPAAVHGDLVVPGAPLSIVAVREDAAFRTNLVLANTTAAPLDADVTLVAADGSVRATRTYALPPLGMSQVTRVVRDLGVTGSLAGARLVVGTRTNGGALATYAAVIDDVTNDPRTLLPR